MSGSQLSSGAAIDALESKGWWVVPDVVDQAAIDSLNRELAIALARREQIRMRNAVDGANDGTLHHLLADGPIFLDLLSQLERFDSLLQTYFTGNYILNSYGGVINERHTRAYVHNVHRDIRFSSQARRFMLNILVMLDPFTLENGATHVLSGSQDLQQKPDQEYFMRRADRAVGSAGSVLLFDSRVWHATGENRTALPRRALTITLTSPFFKQQLDYPRLLGYDCIGALTPFLKQIVGYNARVPATLDEYYVPADQRFYKRGQDD